MGPQEASCRFTSGFTFAHCDYFRFLSIIIFAFPLDYRISCFRLRFIRFGLLDSYVFDLDFYIFDFEFKIFDFEFKILDFDCKNRRLRLKYYCSYFCPQRNAISSSCLTSHSQTSTTLKPRCLRYNVFCIVV